MFVDRSLVLSEVDAEGLFVRDIGMFPWTLGASLESAVFEALDASRSWRGSKDPTDGTSLSTTKRCMMCPLVDGGSPTVPCPGLPRLADRFTQEIDQEMKRTRFTL